MNLRRELLLTVGALVALNLVLSFGAIGLFMRMGPAIERILHENVYTIVAAEKILGELARLDGATPLNESQKAVFSQALTDAERNITEEEERPVLRALREGWPRVASGKLGVRAEFVDDLERLVVINRNAMNEVDERAKRLGSAGAWSAVFIGFSNFLLSLLVLARMERRFVLPLVELHEVVNAARQGQNLRRCRPIVDAPREVLNLTESVNRMLDERLADRIKRGGQ